MNINSLAGITRLLASVLAAVTIMAGCGGKEPTPSAQAPGAPGAAQPPAQAPAAAAPATQLQPTSTIWTPEELEELLAPIALYPDPVLAQVLIASTNPQEVLDSGNWLVMNPKLEGKALDEAAEKTGFTPPIRALIQFPQVVDQMCQNMGWTEELGQAYVNDQAGTLDAVQRLRLQARDVGNLKTSEQMKVETKEEDGKEVVAISPPSPEVVYVPQYNPTTVYAAPPAAPVATAPATTTVVQEEDEGHSTGTLITTGLLSFGAGLLVSEVFDDDDDDYYGYGWGAPMPYYPPYPYRPAYGSGFYPSNGYNRPNNYIRGSGNNIIINQDDNDYRKRFDNGVADRGRRRTESPISAAKGRRPELNSLNADAARGPKRAAPARGDAWKGQNTYAGAKRGNQGAAGRQTTQARAAPKVQGSYAGARPATQPAAKRATPARAQTRTASQPASTTADRGRAQPVSRAPASARPTAQPQHSAASSRDGQQARGGSSGFSRASGGASQRAASQRGRQSTGRSGGGSSRSSGGRRR